MVKFNTIHNSETHKLGKKGIFITPLFRTAKMKTRMCIKKRIKICGTVAQQSPIYIVFYIM